MISGGTEVPNINDRLIQLRKERKLPQTGIAKAVGLSIVAYQNYEYGTRLPRTDILIKLAQFHNVSADYLLGLTDDPTPR
jgi:transcriptional regulator with XRE-family HTH domain